VAPGGSSPYRETIKGLLLVHFFAVVSDDLPSRRYFSAGKRHWKSRPFREGLQDTQKLFPIFVKGVLFCREPQRIEGYPMNNTLTMGIGTRAMNQLANCFVSISRRRGFALLLLELASLSRKTASQFSPHNQRKGFNENSSRPSQPAAGWTPINPLLSFAPRYLWSPAPTRCSPCRSTEDLRAARSKKSPPVQSLPLRIPTLKTSAAIKLTYNFDTTPRRYGRSRPV